MKLDCSKEIKNVKGVQYKTPEGEAVFLGDVLVEALSADKAGGKMKIYALAQKAATNKVIELDSADLKVIKDAVESCQTYNNIILGQVLEALENVK